jgi:MFS family permease
MYGHKRIFTFGWIWFAFWSFVTGFAYTQDSIIFFSICRAIQGIGPAMIVPNAIALLGRNFSVGNARNAAFACFGAAGPTGAATGALFSALLADYAWWPWCFWILCIACLVISVLGIFVIPGPLFGPTSSAATRPKFDYWGAFTGVGGLVLVNFAINQAPLVGWTTWYIPSLLILGAAFLGLFVLVELNFTNDPLIPIRGLGSEAYFAFGCIIVGWGSHGIWLYYLYLIVSSSRYHHTFNSTDKQ